MSFSELLFYMIMVNSFPKKYFKFSIKKISPKTSANQESTEINNILSFTILQDFQLLRRITLNIAYT